MKIYFRYLGYFLVAIFFLMGVFFFFGFWALKFGLFNTAGIIDGSDRYLVRDKDNFIEPQWTKTEEWNVLKLAIAKDEQKINLVAKQTGVPARLIVAMLVGEQMRLYNSEREIFKKAFAPLRILGVQSQFSWGVMGMKEETAKKVEVNLKDKESAFYLGAKYEAMLDYPEGGDISANRFGRLVNEKDHYYAYLYTALYLKQLMTQWEKSGYNISQRPEIIATLFNLGFDKSVPKSNPQVGGAEIEISGRKYSFGTLAYEFYYSGELVEYFPW